MNDRENVIKEYEDYVNSYISLTTSHDYEFEMHKTVLDLLKEQERLIEEARCEGYNEAYREYCVEVAEDDEEPLRYAVEQDLKDTEVDVDVSMLKEQKAVEPKVSCTEQRCGNCNKVIEMDGWKACPWCGKMIDWERWWQKNGTSGTQTGKPQENRRDG